MARRFKQRKKVCVFDKDNNKLIDYNDVNSLKPFISERGKILQRRVTGTCAHHQRIVAREIKKARQIAILPYQVN